MASIGIDCRLYSPSFTGIGRYVYELVQNLIELDTENSYVLYFNEPQYEEFVCPNQRWTKKLVSVPHYSLAEQSKWHDLLMKEDIDLMHFPHFNAPIRYKKPFVVTIHDLTLHYYPYKSYHPKKSLKKMVQIWGYRYLMGQVVGHAQHIIAVSDNTRDDLTKEYPETANKTSVVLEGVPEHFQKASDADIQAVKQKYAIYKPYLLYTGVWRSHKNLLRLLRAFKQVREAGEDAQLVFTGKKDPAYPEIPALIHELGLESDVILTGFVSDEDLIALNSGAHLFVFPSLYEGFGLPPLEAMQFGVPVVCSRSSSLPQVCGDAVEYFDPRDIDEMSQTILEVLRNDTKRQEMIQKGFENVKRFSWKQMSEQILDIYKSVCNNTRQTKTP